VRITYYGQISIPSVDAAGRNGPSIFFCPTIEFASGAQNYTVVPTEVEPGFGPNFPNGFFVELLPRSSGSIVGNIINYKVEYEFIKTSATQAMANTFVTTWGNWADLSQAKVMNGFRTHSFTWAAGQYFYFRPFFYRGTGGTAYTVVLSDVSYSTELFKII
jgi:hypothetical protein